jgi:2',3'-cyclic-nucleotide 2'-phosphodiesterase (5'-nucleotidase family)
MHRPTIRRGRSAALLLLAAGLAGCAGPGTPRVVVGAAPAVPPASAAASAVRAASAAAASIVPDSAVRRLRILHTNDFHGRLLPEPWASPTGALGGSALLAAHIDSARASFDGPVLLLSAGDDMQGTAISNLSWGAATIASHNALRYTAAAPGNHEFDWGIDTLRARVAESQFPWLAANVVETATGRSPSWLRPWLMLDTLGVKVAIVGLALPETPWVVLADRVSGLTFLPAAPALDAAAREARAAGADFVVATMHIGVVCAAPGTAPRERSEACFGDAIGVAEALTERVDLIVGGHTHRRAITEAAGVPIIEAASYSQALSVTDLERRGVAPARVTDQRVEWVGADGVTPNAAVAALVEAWDARVRPLTGRVVAELAEVLRGGDADSPLGNLLADAFLAATGADAVLVNNGSLRRTLPAGPVTYGTLYEFQPFQNELVVVTVPVSLVRAALEHGAVGPGRRLSVHIAGIRVTIDPNAAQGTRVGTITRADGRVLADTDTVRVGLTDFVAGGGDRFTMFVGQPRQPTGIVDVDALVQYLSRGPQPVRPDRAPRVVFTDGRSPPPR